MRKKYFTEKKRRNVKNVVDISIDAILRQMRAVHNFTGSFISYMIFIIQHLCNASFYQSSEVKSIMILKDLLLQS